jgi:hypothetical protein
MYEENLNEREIDIPHFQSSDNSSASLTLAKNVSPEFPASGVGLPNLPGLCEYKSRISSQRRSSQ